MKVQWNIPFSARQIMEFADVWIDCVNGRSKLLDEIDALRAGELMLRTVLGES